MVVAAYYKKGTEDQTATETEQAISGVRVEHLPKIVILELFAKMSENVTLLDLGLWARVIILQRILLYTVTSITL